LRLQYRGTVDFDARVDARVEAELLRDFPGFGKAFSLALWPVTKALEYKVDGTLGKPEAKPLYIPEIFFKPWHPFKQLFLPDDKKKSNPAPNPE
jgi:hypothetical protein